MDIRTAPALPEPPDWPTTPEEAVIIQKTLTGKTKLWDDFSPVRRIAGVDCSFDVEGKLSFAIVAVLDMATLKPVDVVRATLPTRFPYVPGFLSFREIPVIVQALAALHEQPDLLMVDGQGVAHPRGLGIAAHLGLLTDLPSIGVAKSRLFGKHAEVGPNAGDAMPLHGRQGELVGTVLRSKMKCNPLYISAGHRISQETALQITRQCLRGYRLPEPTRIADKASKEKPEMQPATTGRLF